METADIRLEFVFALIGEHGVGECETTSLTDDQVERGLASGVAAKRCEVAPPTPRANPPLDDSPVSNGSDRPQRGEIVVGS